MDSTPLPSAIVPSGIGIIQRIAGAIDQVFRLMALSFIVRPQVAAATCRGHSHSVNQDAVLARDRIPFRIGVSDGVSSSLRSEVASSVALSSFRVRDAMSDRELLSQVMATDELVREIFQKLDCPDGEGGQATLVVAELRRNGTVSLLNVGDSRAYHIVPRFLGGYTVRQLTEDQTYFHLGAENPYPGQYAQVMYQAIGCTISRPDKVLNTHKLCPGSTLLCCTDGVFKGMRDPSKELAELAATHPHLSDFVDAVMKRGMELSSDDVSCAALRPAGVLGARLVFWFAFLMISTFTMCIV